MHQPRKWSSEELVFTLVLIGAVLVFLFTALTYSPKARALPLVVMVPLLLGLVWELGTGAIGGWRGGVPDNQDGCQVEKEEVQGITATSQGSWRQEIVAGMWIIAMMASMYLLGLIVTMAVFPILYMRFYAKEGWIITLCVALGLAVGCYYLFVKFLEIPMFPGLVFKGLGL